MSVNVSDQTSFVKADAHAKAAIALRLMLDGIDKAAEPGTPRKLGDLRKNKLKRVLGLQGTIVWMQQYAATQEDKQFKNYTTPGTGPHYAENAVMEVVAQDQQYFRRAGLI